MKKTAKSVLALLLSAVIFFSSFAGVRYEGDTCLSSLEVSDSFITMSLADVTKYVNTLDKVNNAVKKIDKLGLLTSYTGVISKALKYAKEVNSIVGVFSSIFQSLFGGGNGSTETPVTLYTLYNGIQDIQYSLADVNRKLDTITSELLRMQISEQEHYRATTAQLQSGYWNQFLNNQIRPMDIYIENYQTELNRAFMNWYSQAGNRGTDTDIVLLHAMITDADTQTASRMLLFNNSDAPETAAYSDAGIAVMPELTVVIPGAAFDALPAYNINSCVQNFKDAVYQYAAGAGYTAEEALLYAQEAYETLEYRLSSKMIQNPALWQSLFGGIKTAFQSYLDSILVENSGISAQLQFLYNVYGFESEAKQTVNDIIDCLIARTALYGTFVADVLEKSSIIPAAEMQTLIDKWMNTVDALETTRTNALTGYDDYCYLTGTRLIACSARYSSDNKYTYLKTSESTSSIYKIIPGNDLSDHVDWVWRFRLDGPEGLYMNSKYYNEPSDYSFLTDSSTTVMLYHLYQKSGQDASFLAYLTRCGTNPGGYMNVGEERPILTKYVAAELVPNKTAEAYTLKAKPICGTTFTADNTYELRNVTDSQWKNFSYHHKVVGSTVDSATGAVSTDSVIAAAFSYTSTEMSGSVWLPKNIVAFETCGTHVMTTESSYKDTFSSFYNTVYDRSFYRDFYVLYRMPVPTQGPVMRAVLLGAPDAGETAEEEIVEPLKPLDTYIDNAADWMGELPEETIPVYHIPEEQKDTEIVYKMANDETQEARYTEYAALIADAAAKDGRDVPDDETLLKIQDEMEKCWQAAWDVASANKNIGLKLSEDVNEYELLNFVDQVFNWTTVYSEDGIESITWDDQINVDLMNAEDVALSMQIAPKAAVRCRNGVFTVFAAYDIVPVITAHSYEDLGGFYEASESVSREIGINDQIVNGLPMTISLPVADETANGVFVRVYDNWFNFDQVEKYIVEVQGEEGGRYAEIPIEYCYTPFSVETGDEPVFAAD